MKYTVIFALTIALLICSVGCGMDQQSGKSGPKVEFVKSADKIDVVIGGNLFTSYMYGDSLTKPVLYPVITPAGIKVNRGYPFEKVEGEATDHAHHIGIFFTYDEVNGNRFWNNKESLPKVEHVKFDAIKKGRGKGTLSTVMNWIGTDGKAVLQEKRDMTFTAGEKQNIIDFSIDLTAKNETVVFEDTKEGMFAIRTAQWLREKDGTGEYFSSDGDRKAQNIWGKRARWVALEGNKDGIDVGIAILNHEPSTNYPTYWHARNYGLFAANPLGQSVFQKKHKVKNPEPFNLTLKPGESAHFNFQVVIYDGKRTAEQIEEIFKAGVK